MERRMSGPTRRLLSSALAGLAFLTGCASTSDIATRYGAISLEGDTLLLATRSPDPQVRKRWENACEPAFRKQGYDVTQSFTVLPAWFATGTDELERWASANGIRNILVAELTGLLPAPPHYNPPEVLSGNNMHHDVQIMVPAREYRETRDAAEADQNIEVNLLNNEGRILWRADVVTREANNIAAIARSQCEALAKSLRQNNGGR
jgi:hypothetical protein